MLTLIKKEWLDIRRDKVSSILLISFTLLLVVSLLMSWQYHQWYSHTHKETTDNARRHWETQGTKNSHSAAHFGIYLFKPLSPLALWDTGVDKHTGVSLFIEAHKRNDLQLKAVEDNPLLARWGELTPAYVLIFLLPLLTIWLACNSVIKERTDGTLKLVLSQGISLKKYVWGKALTLWIIAFVLITLLWIIAGVLVSVARSESFFTFESFWLLGVYLFFNGIFIHLSLFVSLRTKNERNALAFMIGLWLIMVWFIPRVSTQLSEQLFPSPSTEVFLKKIAEDIAIHGINGHGGENEKMKKLKEEWLNKYQVDSIQQLPLNWLGVLLQADENTNNLIYEKHHKALHSQYERQEGIQQLSAFFSPIIPARSVSMSLSGTDLPATIHFMDKADNYRKQFIEKLNNRLRDKSRYNERDTGTVAVWKTLPVFHYTPPDFKTKIDRTKTNICILILWLLVSIGAMQFSINSLKIV